MRKWTITLAAIGALSGILACNNNSENDKASPDNLTVPLFSYTLEEDQSDFTGLPALQSFASATSPDGADWLLFGGRTNGFHGFGADTSFPMKTANQYIYVYSSGTHRLDSVNVSMLPAALRRPFSSTNMQARQVDSFLYVCGGYGQIDTAQKITSWVTHPYIARVHVPRMMAAVRAKDAAALNASVVYTQTPLVKATGGELFKLSDSVFYLVLGHDFEGLYGQNNIHSQQYLDAVRLFRLTETPTSIQVQPAGTLSDNLPDSVTQFRRRDLVVAPAILQDGSSQGISVYGGVFTTAGNAFHHPIYIAGGNTPSYKVDSFFQNSNVYSAPNIGLYDSRKNRMYTTIFGGLGKNGQSDDANFTKEILNINRDYSSGKTSSWIDKQSMPAFVGSEGIFIRASGTPVYQNSKMDIIDFNALKPGKQLIGYIYGGILSDSTEWDPTKNPTWSSRRVYKVYLTKI